jgi:hypothetical protein
MLVGEAFTLLESCLGKDEPELRARAIQLIQRCSEVALNSQEFLDASREVVEEVFSLNEFSVSEIFLFKVVFSNN